LRCEKVRVDFFTSGDIQGSSDRLRGYEVARLLQKDGLETSLTDYEASPGRMTTKVKHVALDFLRKLAVVIRIPRNSVLYVQRGIGPVPTLSLLFLLSSKFILGKTVVFDIDDGEFLFSPFVTDAWIRTSDLVVVGGHELFTYARKRNSHVCFIPTSVDMSKYAKRTHRNKGVTLGFMGSRSTIPNLAMLVKPLGDLARECDFNLNVISARSSAEYRESGHIFDEFEKRGVRVKALPWSVQSELVELQKIDIGLAPLPDGTWERFKCGFKVINYMAAGIPPVASDVGEHHYIVQDWENGLLCKKESEWKEKLRALILDEELRDRIGSNARRTAERKYSLATNVRLLEKELAKI
jgi:glycosyltransferase involved in cell wall biosynthesis